MPEAWRGNSPATDVWQFCWKILPSNSE